MSYRYTPEVAVIYRSLIAKGRPPESAMAYCDSLKDKDIKLVSPDQRALAAVIRRERAARDAAAREAAARKAEYAERAAAKARANTKMRSNEEPEVFVKKAKMARYENAVMSDTNFTGYGYGRSMRKPGYYSLPGGGVRFKAKRN